MMILFIMLFLSKTQYFTFLSLYFPGNDSILPIVFSLLLQDNERRNLNLRKILMFLQLTESATSTANNMHYFIPYHHDVFLKSCTEVLKRNRLVCTPQNCFLSTKRSNNLPSKSQLHVNLQIICIRTIQLYT